MKEGIRTQTEEVAGGSLATSAQPPRVPLPPAANVSWQHTPYAIRSALPLDTPGALRKGLRWLTAPRPLPESMLQRLQRQFRRQGGRIR